jgi:hypothetical protein
MDIIDMEHGVAYRLEGDGDSCQAPVCAPPAVVPEALANLATGCRCAALRVRIAL